MKRIKYVLAVVLLFAFVMISADELTISTSESEITLKLDKDSTIGRNLIDIGTIVTNIEARLNELEEIYAAELPQSDKNKVKGIMTEIISLLSIFPEETYIPIDKNKSAIFFGETDAKEIEAHRRMLGPVKVREESDHTILTE